MRGRPPQGVLAPVLAQALAMALFSVHYLAAKKMFEWVDPFGLAALRGLGGGAVLLAAAALTGRIPSRAELRAPVVARLVAAAAFGFFINQILFLEGLKRSTATEAALLSNLIPLVASLMGWMAGTVAWSPRGFSGLLLGLGAVTAYLLHLSDVAPAEHLYGNLLLLGSVFLLCSSFLISRDLMRRFSPGFVTGCVLFGGGAMSLALAPAAATRGLLAAGGDPYAAMLLVFEMLVSTSLAWSLNFFALQRLSVPMALVFNYLQPVLTAGLSWIVLGLRPTAALAGLLAGVVFSGALVVSGEKIRPGRATLKE